MQRGDASRQVLRLGRLQVTHELFEQVFRVANLLQGARSRHRNNATHARGDRLLGDDLAEAHLSRVGEVRAAAKLDAELAHADHAHRVGIFFTEEGHGPQLFGLLQSQDACRYRSPFRNAGINFVLDREDFFVRQSPLMGKVEAKVIFFDLGAALRRRFPQRLTQRVMQQVRRRVGTSNGTAAFDVDCCLQTLADLQPPFLQMADVQDERAVALRIDDVEAATVGGQRPRVADLAPRLAVKRGPVEDNGDGSGVAQLLELIDELFFGNDADHFSFGLDRFVPKKLGRAGALADRVERAFGHDRIEKRAAAAADLMLIHQVLKPLDVDGQVLLGGHRFGQLNQKAVRLM